MKRYIVGFIAGLALTASVGTAANLGEWRDMKNEKVWCSIGRPGTGLGVACVAVDGKWDGWAVIFSGTSGIEVTNANNRVVFRRGY